MAATSVEVVPSAMRRFSLDRRRVYILPTRHGIAYGVALMVMLVGSINYANSLGYSLTFLLGAVGLVTLLHTYRNMVGLVLRVGEPTPIFEGDRVVVPISVDNRTGRERFGICLSIPEPATFPAQPRRRRIKRREILGVSTSGIAPRCIAQHSVTFRATRRGVHDLIGLQVSSRFPLGLFRAWSVLERQGASESLTYTVYPAPIGSAPLPEPIESTAQRDQRTRKGREDFAGLREYQRGDPPRSIHWKAVARGQGIPVKEFAGEGSGELDLKFDQTTGGLETRLSQLSRWLLEAEANGWSYSLHLPGASLDGGTGPTHQRQCLEMLAEVPSEELEPRA